MPERTVAIIQARMGSTRLPGKVLMDLEGRTMLARVLERAARAPGLDEVQVATTVESSDDMVVAECAHLGIKTTRGSVADVLDRYYQAARSCQAEAVARITADCPLLDPNLVGDAVHLFWQTGADYVSNSVKETYPRGLDIEVVSIEALAKTWRDAQMPYQRAHVTPYIYEHPELFSVRSLEGEQDFSRYRWTVDTAEDLAFVRLIYRRLGAGGAFGWRDVLELLEEEPALLEVNRGILQKALKEG